MAENPGTETIENLLKQVDAGAYVIPYFQRGFEWQPGMVCDLIQSVLQDYYAGLILLWELEVEEAKKEEWEPIWGARMTEKPRMAVLDGQQRLASLYYAIHNPTRTFPNRKSYYVFMLDLNSLLNEDYEEAVFYKYYGSHQSWQELWGDGRQWAEEGCLPLPILSVRTDKNQRYIDTDEFFMDWIRDYYEHNQREIPDEVQVSQIPQILNRILQYSFVYFPLSADRALPDICNIFARVNEKGMKLSTFDLMNAFLYPKGIKLRKVLWEQLDNDRLKAIDAKVNEYLLKLISLVKQNYCSSKYIYNLVPGQKVLRRQADGSRQEEILVADADQFSDLWDNACRCAERARAMIMNTGSANFGAIKSEFIPNTTIIPVLGAMLWVSGLNEDAAFRRYLSQWYWSAVLSEDYSGSSDTVMSEDFRAWQRHISENGLAATPARLQKVDTNFIHDLDLSSTDKGSSRYNAVICMLALNEARDFYQGQIAGSVDYSNERINDHHIFPTGAKSCFDPRKSSRFAEAKDSILNRTLLLDETNRHISSKPPSEYVAEMIEKHGSEDVVRQILSSHLINDRAFELMKADDFDQFIAERERSIKQHMASVLGLAREQG